MLQRLLVDVVRQEDDTVSWTRLLGFTSACLVVPGRGGKSRNFTTLVNRQIRSYDGPVGVTMGADQGRATKFRSVATDNDSEAAKRASAKLEEGDVRGAIRILASKDTVAPVNDATVASLRALHPSAPTDLRPPPTSSVAPLHATSLDVRAAIISFPNGSAGGPDGLRPQHLKDLMAGKGQDDPLLDAITQLVNLMLAGGT